MICGINNYVPNWVEIQCRMYSVHRIFWFGLLCYNIHSPPIHVGVIIRHAPWLMEKLSLGINVERVANRADQISLETCMSFRVHQVRVIFNLQAGPPGGSSLRRKLNMQTISSKTLTQNENCVHDKTHKYITDDVHMRSLQQRKKNLESSTKW